MVLQVTPSMPSGLELLHFLLGFCKPNEGSHLQHEALAKDQALLPNEMMGCCTTVPDSDVTG
jgi:hypothetical protein